MVATLKPVSRLIGEMNKPIDCRAPIVSAKMPAAASVVIQISGRLRVRNMVGRLLARDWGDEYTPRGNRYTARHAIPPNENDNCYRLAN
jgi:hypothetical protein